LQSIKDQVHDNTITIMIRIYILDNYIYFLFFELLYFICYCYLKKKITK